MMQEDDTAHSVSDPSNASQRDLSSKTAFDEKYPSSRLVFSCHPLTEKVTRQANEYFLRHWEFPSEESRQRFIVANSPRSVCLSFPQAKDDRIYYACIVIILSFFVDDVLDTLSVEDGRCYVKGLLPICRGERSPDRKIPVEWMFFDLWENMRSIDDQLARRVLESLMVCMSAQTSNARSKRMSFGKYLEYREKDIGGQFMCTLLQFCMEIRLSPDELLVVQPFEKICIEHMTVINDIWSFEKELSASQIAHPEGAFLFNSVAVFGEELGLPAPPTKMVLYYICRQWEARYSEISRNISSNKKSTRVTDYLRGLEFIMAGAEEWSKKTPRYIEP